jgi:anti-sigma regulatory factor (Ser/Thr protein kinase)
MDDDVFDVWLRVPARPENVAIARQALAGLCEALPTSPKVLADVKLAVTEACTNCVVHAYPNGLGEDAVFEVEADPGEDELLVIVRDYGRGISPNTESPGLGLGLPLIAALSRTVEFRGGNAVTGTEVIMSFGLDEDLGDGNGR